MTDSTTRDKQTPTLHTLASVTLSPSYLYHHRHSQSRLQLEWEICIHRRCREVIREWTGDWCRGQTEHSPDRPCCCPAQALPRIAWGVQLEHRTDQSHWPHCLRHLRWTGWERNDTYTAYQHVIYTFLPRERGHVIKTFLARGGGHSTNECRLLNRWV